MGIKWKMDIPYVLEADIRGSTELDIKIPSKVDGLPVKVIHSGLFKNTRIKSLFIPSSVEEIGDSAFYECKQLKIIQIEKGSHLKVIGEKAFFNTEVRNFPFEQCPELKVIKLMAFAGSFVCKADLSETQISEISMGCFAHSSIKEVIFPPELICIGCSAFEQSSLEKVDFSNLKNPLCLEEASFKDCFELGEITFSNKEMTFKEAVFQGCIYLKELTIPVNVKLAPLCFFGCSALKTVVFEEGTPSDVSIPSQVFGNCFHLEEVIIKANYEIIETAAFLNCNQLSKIQFPKTLTTIASMAFKYCSNLRVVDLTGCCMQYIYEGCFDFSGVGLDGIILDYMTGVHIASLLNAFYASISYENIKEKYPFATVVSMTSD